MEKIILEGDIDYKKEDNGRALIAEVYQVVSEIPEDEDENNGIFVRIQSWDDSFRHTTMKSIQGKKVRVTIEVIE